MKKCIDQIYNEDCLETMGEITEGSVDVILTSPPYGTSVRCANSKSTLLNSRSIGYPSYRYDCYVDNMDCQHYLEWTEKIFHSFGRILKRDGVVLYNISYSSGNPTMMFRAVNEVLTKTEFSLADMICWKKRSALPNNVSRNRLTRIFEPVFVFCRDSELKTFNCNKKCVGTSQKGQKIYENVFNYIDARNNDGQCKLNLATYSTELCDWLLGLYCPAGGLVYDPFMGTGTTAVSCVRNGMHYIGSELSEKQVVYARKRINDEIGLFSVQRNDPSVPVTNGDSTRKPSFF